jgi:hypothetical protein
MHRGVRTVSFCRHFKQCKDIRWSTCTGAGICGNWSDKSRSNVIQTTISSKSVYGVEVPSRLPSYSHDPESIGKHGEFCEHSGEPLDQRQQSRVRHIGDQIVEHAALAEQRVGAPLGGV